MSVPAYAPWQARDFLLDRGRSGVLIVALFLLQDWITLAAARRQLPPAEAAAIAAAAPAMMMPLLGFVLVLFAVNGLVSGDRSTGAYRMLLARPVRADALYAQAFVLHGAGTLLVGALFLAGHALMASIVTGAPPPPVAAMAGATAYLALYYLALGGIGFALSAFARLDWASTAGVWAAALLLRSAIPFDASWAAAIDWLLPPTHSLSAAGDALLAGQVPPLAHAARVALYGAVAIALALWRLRHRPFDD